MTKQRPNNHQAIQNMIEKIIIADDHPMFRSALSQAIGLQNDAQEIIECASVDSLKEQLKQHSDADLLLLDLNMPGADGFSALAYVQQKYPFLPTVIISAHDKQQTMSQAKQLGAIGFISKSATIEQIHNGIQTVLQGQPHFPEAIDNQNLSQQEQAAIEISQQLADLTPQQYKVLNMIKQGLLNKQIAYDLNISEATVKAHVTAIMRKLKVNNRTQAVMKASSLEIQ